MLGAILFDFDGVILESVDLKARAFRRLFRSHPHFQDGIVRLHLENGGMSRYQKFRLIYEEMLHLPLSEVEMARLDQQYSAIVLEEIDDCPYVLGARDFVERRAGEYPLFIVSGTPEAELRAIVTRRGLAPFFVGVYGSPSSKSVLLERILQQIGHPPENLLFIGDALQDYHAAREVGVSFIGRVPKGAHNPFPASAAVALVGDLSELEAGWPEIREGFA